MSRLIDADKLKGFKWESVDDERERWWNYAIDEIMQLAPTVEADSIIEGLKEAVADLQIQLETERNRAQVVQLTDGEAESIIKTLGAKNEQLRNDLRVALEKNSNWIPCSERLPKVGEDVLVTVTTLEDGYKAVETRHVIDDNHDSKWWWEYKGDTWEVTAWQPLPSPYGEENEEC